MPIYEYHCGRCERNFEVIQKFADEPLKVHEGCGGTVERLISSSAFQFKGTGWYVTDYARKNSSPGNGKSNEASGGGESKSTAAKSETSTATKSDTSKSDSKSDSKSSSK